MVNKYHSPAKGPLEKAKRKLAKIRTKKNALQRKIRKKKHPTMEKSPKARNLRRKKNLKKGIYEI